MLNSSPDPSFFPPGGREIDRDFFGRKGEAGVFECRPDAVPAFPNGCIRQAHDGKLWKPAANIDFDFNQVGL